MIVRLWLLWQTTIFSMLIFLAFLLYRTHLKVTSIGEDLRFVRDLLLVLTQTWGQKPDDVRAALATVASRIRRQGG